MRPAPLPTFQPYPINLEWRRVTLRRIVLNEVLMVVGVLSMHATEALTPQRVEVLGMLYYFIWLQVISLFGLVIVGGSIQLAGRHAWRHTPDAQAHYRRHGLYKGLLWRHRFLLIATTVIGLPLGAWLSQQVFILIQHSTWGLDHLSQVYPLYKMTLFNACYGAMSVYVFEYFLDRAAVSEAREREALKLTAEAQLNLLRSQLDPHMLFNTLSNLYELIDENPDQARELLLNLIAFLRSTLSGSRAAQHELGQEFQLAQEYLALMQIRMGERLRVCLDLPVPLRQHGVPAMLLQPLIENAIKHGLERRKQGGELSVAASQEQSQLVLRVSNSGAHASPSSLPVSNAPDTNEPRAGFGLQYVKERLQTLYADQASIDIEHLHEQDQTQVTLRLPLFSNTAST